MTDDHTRNELDALLRAANRLPSAEAADLPLGDAREELYRALLAQASVDSASASAPAPAPRASRWRGRRLVPRLALAVAIVFAVSMAVLSLGKGGEQTGTVWAAELVRLAEASPLVLLDAPGWQVSYADEQSEQEGELRFANPDAQATASVGGAGVSTPPDVSRTDAALNWRAGELSEWTRDRAASANLSTTAPVLGTTARVYQYDGGRPGHQDITALWGYDDRVLEFRAGVADMPAFKVLLAALRQVDTDTWLKAMPDSVVKTTDRSTAITKMLRGVTVTPGFDPSSITGEELTKDRYQLGVAVTGTVACSWFKRWSDAHRSGDEVRVKEAIAAMRTAKDWPILEEMARSGAYPAVLLNYVKAMPSGRWHGRRLEGDVDSGLGCTRAGIPLR